MRTLNSKVSIVSLVAVITALGGCHKSQNGDSAPQPQKQVTDSSDANQASPQSARQGKVTIPTRELPVLADDGERIDMPNGEYIDVATIKGTAYIPVEGAFDNVAFERVLQRAKSQSTTEAERKGRLQAELQATVSKLQANVALTQIKTNPTLGYFTALVALADYEALDEVRGLPESLVINPVFTHPLDERSVRRMDEEALDVLSNPRANTEAFSGLKRIGVPEFLAQVEAELGSIPNGSRVRVGVTDTGITYGHPAFMDADGKSRISYMKEFTGEGRILFHPSAKFELTIGEDGTASVVAQVLPATEGTRLPSADDLKEITGTIQLAPELLALISQADVATKLGVMSETSYAGIDLNQNGKTDDTSYALLISNGDSYQIYFDPNGELDFRQAKGLSDFNASGDTMEVVSEVFGFDIRPTTLANAAGEEVAVIGASIVGFDPGAHGSHVTGIISGRKTITNDDDSTLARGIAPAADIMMNRVCANSSGCDSTEAVIDLAQNGAEIINMSIGGLSAYNDGYSVGEIIINRLTETNNVLFVISAGNAGPGLNTVGSPSTAHLALSVGATASRDMIQRQYQWPGVGKSGPSTGRQEDDNDFMLFFSSRGPTAAGGFKPNISAPGTELSAVPFNTTAGARRGLDVYWGTSMAAPAAAGSIALLLDAAKLHNEKFPENPLPTDALTLRKVIMASARPFDVTRFDPESGEFTRGQYTWVDQGMGMINLPNAWAALKAERDTKLPSAVYAVDSEGVREDIELDYQVRVLRTNPNGLIYDGSQQIPEDLLKYTGPLYGRGIWFDANDTDTLIPVQIARRLPYSATLRDDVGALKRLLATTMDEFVLKTVYYGSNKEWLKAGTLDTANCAQDPSARIVVIGEGATDNLGETSGASTGASDSMLNVCMDRAAINQLPAGDHGALIMGYREVDGVRSAHPDFIVPVYVTKPQQTLAGSAGYEIDGTVQSFGVDRHYVRIPEGTSLVTVKLEVPEADVDGTVVSGCQGVRLYAYEAGNTATPIEIGGLASIAANCDIGGGTTPDTRIVSYVRSNPKAGVWDLHVFGRYQMRQSNYKLSVEFAKVQVSLTEIAGTPDVLDGAIDFSIVEASLNAEPSSEKSELVLEGLAETLNQTIMQDEYLNAPNGKGEVARSYPEGVTSVTITTGGSTGNDLDLFLLECDAADLETAICITIGQSTTATDEETITFEPQAGSFYVANVHGYAVAQSEGGPFVLKEIRQLSATEQATLAVTANGEAAYTISYEFDQEASPLLTSELFTSGQFSVVGSLIVRTVNGDPLIRVPVSITAPE